MKPDWLKNVIHIPCEDQLRGNSDGNIILKVLRACKIKGLSPDFLFMNDDYLIMKQVDATKIPAYHKGNMTDFPESYFRKGFWRSRLERTKNVLVRNGYPAYHYDGHIPMIMNKKKFPEIISRFNYKKGIGFTMKSLYGNLAYEKGVFVAGIKKVIFKPKTLDMLNTEYNRCAFASVNDQGMTLEFKKWVFSRFPEQSKYEKNVPEGMMAALTWFNSGMNIQEGIDTYKDYGKSGNVKRFMRLYPDQVTVKKLEYHLHKLL
jgi:hypothetical protein